MKIQVLQVELVGPDRYRAVIRAGEREVVTEILVERIADVFGFNFAEQSVKVLAYYCPFGREFADDFDELCRHQARPVPWEYGDFAESRIQHAWEVADSEMRRHGGTEAP